MPTTQYIGSRYVPLLADPVEWSSTKEYEPLTIVTHEGNSYTSRQFVPKGIDITNNDYWAMTGNYNAQVEQYRREVAQYRHEVDEFGNSIIEKQFAFDTVEAMQNSTNLYNGAICHTNGFKESGDGGASWYVISSTGPKNDMDVIACGSLFAHLVVTKEYLYMEQLNLSETNMQEVLNRGFALCNELKMAKNESAVLYVPIIIPSEKHLDFCGNTLSVNGTSNYAIQVQNGKNTFIENGYIVGPSDKSMNCIKLHTSDNSAVRNCTLKRIEMSNFNICVYIRRAWIIDIFNCGCSHCNICFDLSLAINAINIVGGNYEYDIAHFMHGDVDTSCGGLYVSNATIEGLSDTIFDFENESSANVIEIRDCYFENSREQNDNGAVPLLVNKSIHDYVKIDSCVNSYSNRIVTNGLVDLINTDCVLKSSYPTPLRLCKRTFVPYIDYCLSNPSYDKYKTVIEFDLLEPIASTSTIYTIDEYPNLFFMFKKPNNTWFSNETIDFKTMPIRSVAVYVRETNRTLFHAFFDMTFDGATPQSKGRTGILRNESGQSSSYTVTHKQAWLINEMRQQIITLTGAISGTQGGNTYEAISSYDCGSDVSYYLHAVGLDF